MARKHRGEITEAKPVCIHLLLFAALSSVDVSTEQCPCPTCRVRKISATPRPQKSRGKYSPRRNTQENGYPALDICSRILQRLRRVDDTLAFRVVLCDRQVAPTEYSRDKQIELSRTTFLFNALYLTIEGF